MSEETKALAELLEEAKAELEKAKMESKPKHYTMKCLPGIFETKQVQPKAQFPAFGTAR